mmetsp:Transcript_43598/g.79428  ORF Transcript_43598/g.79428 Transcript_43598/m.79428 type:complete len:215 (-) Transcript_43598:94-738(-)
MGLREDELTNRSAVSDTLQCPVCMDFFEDPVFCGGRPCQHVFCRLCVEQALEKSEQCPTCRAPMSPSDLQPHLVVRSLLDEVMVRCEHSCGWTGRRDARPAHAAVCPVVRLQAAEARLRLYADVDKELADRDSKIRELEAALKQKDEEIVRMGKELLRRQVCITKLEHAEAAGIANLPAMVPRKLDSFDAARHGLLAGISAENAADEGSSDLWL